MENVMFGNFWGGHIHPQYKVEIYQVRRKNVSWAQPGVE